MGRIDGAMAEPLDTIGKRVAFARKQAGFSQVAFAAKVGVDPSTISKTERDKSVPEGETIRLIAEVAGVSAGWILEGDSFSGVISEPLGDESRPLVDRLLAVRDDFSRAKKAWIRARLEETQRLDGDDPDRVWQDIRDLATVYEYETGRRLPLPGHETVVAEPRESGDGVMIRPRNKKPKR